MVTPIASRFAVLPVDDDGDTSRRITAKSLKKKEAQQSKPQINTGSKQDTKKKQNKRNPEQPTTSKSKPKPKNGNSKKKSSQDEWEEWKQKDAEFVDGNYADDLHNAMLLSKLDYEEKKEYYAQIKKASEEEKKAGNKKNKKSNKAQPMTLSQFNQLGDQENKEIDIGASGDASILNGKREIEEDDKFYDKIKSEAKKTLQAEQAEDQRKAREPFINDVVAMNQLQACLEESNKEISRLKSENESLQEELLHVKTRNKKLCQLLFQGEMKDKAEVLVEVDKLQRVRDELSTEVSSLAAQLEQEKSKVRALTIGDAKGKDKLLHKKNVRFSTASDTSRSK